jgi:RimJ/RimL family protein N-acetyltransferase
MAARNPEPVTLRRGSVRLEPLAFSHVEGLFAATGDDDVWRWLSHRRPTSVAEMNDVVSSSLAMASRMPFAIVVDDVVVGSTSYYDIDVANERLEIGYTFLGKPWWRTQVNTTCKLLLLDHAFDDLGMGRVALRTDHRNERSQAAISRLGATREGVLRRHVRRPDGSFRDSVYYSILRDEWSLLRNPLIARLD